VPPSEAPLDLLAVGETLVDFISVEQTDWLRNATTFALPREACRSAVRRAFRLAHEGGKIVSLDPNYGPRVWPDKEEAWEVLAEVIPYVTIVKPSLEDARRLFDCNMDDETLKLSCLNEFHDLGAEVVVFTSSGGVVTVSDGSTIEQLGPLTRVEVKNVTGARDSFWAGLLVAHLDGNDWPTCVKFADEVAKVKLGVDGHVQRMIDRRDLYGRFDDAVEKV
jgi:sugar/nucleoside kinase (ribokinase family)